MPRCNQCPTCLSVIEFRKSNRKNRKKIKRYEFNNVCEDTTVPQKKRRLTEVESLDSAGYKVKSGRVVGINHLVSTLPTDARFTVERSARPKGNLNEDSHFNSEKYDEYVELVLQCTQTFECSESSDVTTEGPSMIKKMRGLLDPSVKFEVDYEEAVKDVSNVLFMWKMDAAAGKRAFIPDMDDRDLCYAAVKIFSHAAEEAKLIPEEFCKEFGRVGIPVYNDLIGIIGERDKNCLPFVNMCLRTWKDRLSVDPDVWADQYLFNFDKWIEEQLAEPLSNQHGSKTSYELMMAVFGSSQESNNITPTVNPPTSKTATQLNDPTTKSRITFTNPLRPAHDRMSQLQKVGKSVQEHLFKSHYYRAKQNASDKATEEIEAAISSTSEGKLNEHIMKRCREASRKMEDLLFSVGGVERIVTTLRYFRRRKTVHELDKAMDIIDGDVLNKNRSKEGKVNGMVMDGLRDFLGMFSSSTKGGGRRSLEDQNVFDAIMAAINTKELTSAKLGRMLSRLLNVSRRQIKRGRAIRADFEDRDKKNWVRRASTVPKSAIKDGKDQIDSGDQFGILYSPIDHVFPSFFFNHSSIRTQMSYFRVDALW